ncbi:zinc finger protein 276 [Genypterus blacodes]|uniref:zinc finger protein 276 n=1 Tax=Genypterus blacodes TaxID=154954 RepID=UPI003F76CBA4
MKKKSRQLRSTKTLQQSSRAAAVSVVQVKRPSGNRGRPRKTPTTTESFYQDATIKPADFDGGMTAEDPTNHPNSKTKPSGRLSSALCRLCHGMFSPRSLRHAFHSWAPNSADIIDNELDVAAAAAQSLVPFHSDFQRLVGVQVDRDPRLSEFICKKCHTKFYKCQSILVRFLQRVNLPPFGKDQKNTNCTQSSVNQTVPPSFTSDSKCLHSLVSWAHQHGEACRSCPALKEVLEGQCWGSVKAVWGCVDGHSHAMDARCAGDPGFMMNLSRPIEGSNCDDLMSEGDEEEQEQGRQHQQEGEDDDEEQSRRNGKIPGGSTSGLGRHSPALVAAQTQSSALPEWSSSTQDFTAQAEPLSPALDSDLSERVMSEDEFEESRKRFLDDDLFQPFPEKRPQRVPIPSRRRSPKAPEEPKVRKKPGPKPGWKNKFKPKGEELPNIYKCPYQGCTAVYRAPDGLKKHIKEHHEEVRERPCPHPGCNKVFMIDRYLQRHIKLIHTEERNYICDQCGQTFKQRKHLSVHQMRHSGAKPLQCEVCGFQCRQRASLKYHMTKHKAEADLEFACLLCGKRFEKAHNLNVHMSMVHPLTQTEATKGDGQQQQQQQQRPPYSDIHTITLTGEVVQQDHDR